MKQKKLNYLSISPFIPYDNVNHAGGKIYNFYIKKLHNSKEFDLKIITTANEVEVKSHDLKKYKINHYIKKYDKLTIIIKYIFSFFIFLNPYSKWGSYFKYPYYKNFFIYKLKELKKQGYKPDIINLEWTQSGLLIKKIKKIFPDAYFIVVEHDVVFQRYKRLISFKKNLLKYINNLQFNNLKRNEIDMFKSADLIICLNNKDIELIKNKGIQDQKLYQICPFFQQFENKPKICSKKKSILFYGYLKRKENYMSVIWFIENVFMDILKKYTDTVFYIVGAEPKKILYKYQSQNIKITGFVDNVGEYFNKSTCMVVPLLMGGGIKIKVLEGMSAGIPIITNSIGIEGIPAKNSREYIHAENAQDYINAIDFLFQNPEQLEKIRKNSIEFIKSKFNYLKSFIEYKDLILNRVKKNKFLN